MTRRLTPTAHEEKAEDQQQQAEDAAGDRDRRPDQAELAGRILGAGGGRLHVRVGEGERRVDQRELVAPVRSAQGLLLLLRPLDDRAGHRLHPDGTDVRVEAGRDDRSVG